ncbi:spike base protein, RCAP_Rcc01079 family [Vogesella urethralis]|uniref:spike base protein, RCAP_Rcc01079 family n=1 Tax=Vogesella urethralis TaxID=2592656 RepID=UPI00197EFDDE|nr:hypothetical protein [Vogesella urethralis]
MPDVMPSAVAFPNSGPANGLLAISPSDSVDAAYKVRQIYVGTGGDVRVMQGGVAVTFKNVPAGATLGPFLVDKVFATGTTAADLVGFL